MHVRIPRNGAPLSALALFVLILGPLGQGACGPRCGPGTRESGALCVPATETHAGDVTDTAGTTVPPDTSTELPELPTDPGTPTGLLCPVSAFQCPPLLVCRLGQCIVPPAVCVRDRDCPAERVCDTGACVSDCGDSNGACPSDRICVEGRCVSPPPICADVRDCPHIGDEMACADGRCVAHCGGPCSCVAGFVCRAGTCEPEGETCEFADDCGCIRGGARPCGEGHACGQSCGAAADCPAGEACLAGRCARPPTICGDDGDCPVEDGAALRCVFGACKRACADACDCRAPRHGDNGETCVQGYCALVGFTCETASDCSCKDGIRQTCGADETCTFGACTSACDCAGGLFCADGRCVAYPPGSCDSQHPCACGMPCTGWHGFGVCGCERQEDCEGGTVCDLATRRCTAPPASCEGKGDCPSPDHAATATSAPNSFCEGGACATCQVPFGACEGNDAACPSCDGHPMVCHPINQGFCSPQCRSGVDCYFTFGQGACDDGRCVPAAARSACDTPDDCPGVELAASGRFAFLACEGHRCVPEACIDSGDCAPYPSFDTVDPYVCRAGNCVAAPAVCATNADCPWPAGEPTSCEAPGVCR